MKYFTIAELTDSDTARKHGIKNVPNDKEIDNMVALVDELLDPIRHLYGSPIYVNSGFRCKKLNRLVGGVSTSQHLTGEAADIDTRKGQGSNMFLFSLIKESGLPFDQLIDEHDYKWIHVSFSRKRCRQQIIHTK